MQRNVGIPKPRRLRTRSCRKGATTVEFAVIGSIALLLLIGFAVLALGVYRYQQVAYLARVGARYASTHGAQYLTDNRMPAGDTSTWAQDIRDNEVLPRCSSLDPTKLTVNANWSAGDNVANAADSTSGSTATIHNSVTVTVNYQWISEAFLSHPVTMTSSATMPMSY